jgi:hypothetical protein
VKIILLAALLGCTFPGLWLSCYLLRNASQLPEASEAPQSGAEEQREALSVSTKDIIVPVFGRQLALPAIISRFQRIIAFTLLIAVAIYWSCCLILLFHAPAIPR